MSSDHSRRMTLFPLLAFVLVAFAQVPLVLNPGYFSHDEFQWAAFAADGHTFDWTAIDLFQYRPLTFSLWLWLSGFLFDSPQAFHAVLVAAGAANAALAGCLARRLGAAPGPALMGAVLFGIGPQAMYVHGWIGTIGDILWVGAGLLAALAATSRRLPLVAAVLLVACATLAGLLAKEAAVAIPPLLALAAWLAAGRGSALRLRLGTAAVAAGVVVVAYLALRLGALLEAPRSGDGYAVSVAHVPLRWLEQQLYPFDPGRFEVHSLLAGGVGKRIAVSAVLWLGIVVALARAGWRWPVAFVLGGLAALAPALPLASAANQYAYAFSCVTTMVAACAWPRLPRWAKALLLFVALLLVLHGANVMRHMYGVGVRQARFSPAVAAMLRTHDGPLRLRVGQEADEWIYLRLTHNIPHYDGVPFGERVSIVRHGEPADALVREDGSLAPLR